MPVISGYDWHKITVVLVTGSSIKLYQLIQLLCIATDFIRAEMATWVTNPNILSQDGFLCFSSQRINPFYVFGLAFARVYYTSTTSYLHLLGWL